METAEPEDVMKMEEEKEWIGRLVNLRIGSY